MTVGEWPAVARIYAAGIEAGNATFEREVPSWQHWHAARSGLPCLVAKNAEGIVVGWAALSPVSARAVYRGVAAISIYVDPRNRREGVARELLLALIAAAEHAGLWTLEAGIFPENLASVALHECCGFRLVGVRHRVGQMADGSWRDVLLYERRSEVVGVVLAHAPEFVEGTAAADSELAAGQTVSLASVRAELEDDKTGDR